MKIKSILGSVALIALVGTLGYVGTTAYFNDTETSEGNVLAAGTIDIAVNDENPWTATEEYVFEDLLPGEDESTLQTIKNVGSRNAMVWKRIDITSRENYHESEPECYAHEGAAWDISVSRCDYSGSTGSVDDLDTQMIYGMTVGAGTNIDPVWKVTMADLDGLWIPLGLLEANGEVEVGQTYLFSEDATNHYQGDKLTYTITYYAAQEGTPGPAPTTRGVVLVAKALNPENGYYEFPVVGTGTWGLLTWDDSGNFHMRAWGLPGTQYRLQAWNYTSNSDLGMFGDTQSGGNVDYTGNYAGLVNNNQIKYWLRDTSGSWPNANALWESNLVDGN